MTEPNDATTPLSRMRFSWQRDQGPGRSAPGATPEAGPEATPGSTFDAQPAAPDEPSPDGAWTTGEHPVVTGRPPTRAQSATPVSPPQERPTHGRPSQGLPSQGPLWSPSPEPAYRTGENRVADGPGRVPEAHATRAAQAAQKAYAPPAGRPAQPPAHPPRAEPNSSPRLDDVDVTRLQDEPARARSRPPARTGGGRERFEVPPPGGRFSGGRGTHAFVRAILVLTVCLLALSTVGYVAFSFGAMAVQDNSYALDEKDIQRYRLSEFPVEPAGRFAADFARLCLTHNPDPAAIAQRKRDIAAYVVDGVDPMCGWNGQGEQYVADAAWTGRSEPIETGGYAGHARMMGVRVLTDTGSRIVQVPVYVRNLGAAEGMRIVGEIGEMPQPTLVGVAKPAPEAATDNALALALEDGEFFTQFFSAWGASDESTLQRLITPDASAAAKGGLAGSLQDPRITRSRVFFPSGVDGTDPDFTWETGAVTEAWVWVTWRNSRAGEDTQETRAYRLQLVKTAQAPSPAQEWTVRDIRGGVPAVRGG